MFEQANMREPRNVLGDCGDRGRSGGIPIGLIAFG